MNDLVELSKTTHKDIKINPREALIIAAEQQTLNLKVSEVSHAATNFPVFFMPNATTGGWAITILTSFTPSTNLYLRAGKWEATYLPHCVQTYPFFLINSESDGSNYAIGIEEKSDALSVTKGDPLFDSQGKASLHLSQVTNMLKNDIQNTVHTAKFIEMLEKLKLLKAIDLVVHYQDKTSQNMTGLHTIDEDTLNLLPGDELEKLNKKGYLVQIHAMLISLYQVNMLIQKNNTGDKFDKIKNVKFEVTRDKSQDR